jgi:hypothetical protein
MDKADNEFLLKILEMLEQAYFKNLALEGLVESCNLANWRTMVDRATLDPRIQPQTRAAFLSLRQALEHDQPQIDRTSALQALLKLVPITTKIQ